MDAWLTAVATYVDELFDALRDVVDDVVDALAGQLGTRHPVAWYRDGQLQEDRARRPGPLYPAEPWSTVEASDVTGS